MIRCIIVDDEAKSRESLQILIHDFCDHVQVVALCQNIDEAVNAIAEHSPDVVFLDIQLQRETGFDLLVKVKKIEFEVIFTTAYAEYAIRAFKFSAIDYLLKPIDVSELNAAIDRVRKKMNVNISDRLKHLIENLHPAPTRKSRLALPTTDGLVFVKIIDILYCEASSNYTIVHMADGKQYIVSRTLKEYEEMLGEMDFFRIHHTYLVNLAHIKKYVRGDGGYVIMENGKSLDVSKRKKEAFLSHLTTRN